MLKKPYPSVIDHRSMLRDVVGRYGLEDALQRKFAESDHAEERRERQRRRAKQGEVADTESEAAGIAASQQDSRRLTPRHVFSPSKLRGLYQRALAADASAHEVSGVDALRTPPRRPNQPQQRQSPAPAGTSARLSSARSVPHEAAPKPTPTAYVTSSAYRQGCFSPAADTAVVAAVPPVEVSLHHGNLCDASLVRLEAYHDASMRSPPDYAKVRASAFDRERRAELSRTIAEGDEIMKRLASHAAAASGGSPRSFSLQEATSPPTKAAHGVSVHLVTPVMRSPRPVRVAAPRVVYDSLDAFTPADAQAYIVQRQEAHARQQRYRDAMQLDSVVSQTNVTAATNTALLSPTAGGVQYPPSAGAALPTASSQMACERLFQHSATKAAKARSAGEGSHTSRHTRQPAASLAPRKYTTTKAADGGVWVVSSTFAPPLT